MSYRKGLSFWFILVLGISDLSVRAADPAPRISRIEQNSSKRIIRVAPHPSAQEFTIQRSDSLGKPFTDDPNGTFSGYEWTAPLTGSSPTGFYRLQVKPLSPADLLTATVLHRLAYGPTPDEIARVNA